MKSSRRKIKVFKRKSSKESKRVPISLEELIAKHKARESEQIKPKFISKEERQQEALRRRQLEVQAMKEKQMDELKKQQEYLRLAEGTKNFKNKLNILVKL